MSKRKRISEFIIDEILVRVGFEFIWLWVAIDSENRQILAPYISKEGNMFVAERFLDGLIKINGKHPVSTDRGGTWYPQARWFLKLKHHHIHSTYEKSLIERTMQHIGVSNNYISNKLYSSF